MLHLENASLRWWALRVSALAFTLSLGAVGLGGCKKSAEKLMNCDALSGDAWVPNVPGTSAAFHDGTVSVLEQTVTATANVSGWGEGPTSASGRQATLSIDMDQDLGAHGSLTLLADVTNFSSTGLVGGAYPFLLSVNDGTNEWINLTSACTTSGVFNGSCGVTHPSAFSAYDIWQQHQFPFFGYQTVNVFPTCNWADGATTVSGTVPSCAFKDAHFTVGGKLRTGASLQYTLKYALIADSYPTISSSRSATIQVKAIRKTDAALGGAIDLNFVLVGSSNIAASRTAKGQQNLNSLGKWMVDLYGTTNPSIKIGTVKAVEWPCEQGGDAFATVDVDTAIGAMFRSGSALVDTSTEGKALNVFLVSEIISSQSASGGTILGVSGGIGGSPKNLTDASGLVFSTFDELDTFNPACASGQTVCPVNQQDDSFVEMGATIAHECGHFLGLNHPSESDGSVHDPVFDTPVCTNTAATSIGNVLTITSCRADTHTFPTNPAKTCMTECPTYSASSNPPYCPTAEPCQFNHVMWWSSKHNGDGNLFSAYSSEVLNFSSLVR